MKRRSALTPENVAAFMNRDWGLPQRLQLEENRGLVERGDAEEILRRADVLKRSAQLTNPGWPDARTQAEDLEAHRCLAAFQAWRERRAEPAGDAQPVTTRRRPTRA
jgi:hypothetical protein